MVINIFNRNCYAQEEKMILWELAQEKQEVVDVLVLYPEETRKTILEATLHPEVLAKLNIIQIKTSNNFKSIVDELSEQDQIAIWDLTRYPNLISSLAKIKPASNLDWDKLLIDYPSTIHNRAIAVHQNIFPILEEINKLNDAAALAFKNVMEKYSVETKIVFEDLIDLPEVLDVLTNNINLTILIGDVYEDDPQWLLRKTDSLSLVVARENALEFEEWEKNLSENPELITDLEESVEAYKEENTFDDDYYDYEDEQTRSYHDAHSHFHYSFWFSYPYWYTYPRWRCYPNYYDWGFYYHANGPIVFIGFPSYHFTHWYFHHPHHHSHWPNLSAQYVYHARRPNARRTSINASVENWQRENNQIVNEDWLKKDDKLSRRFEEFGRMETERQKYNTTHPKSKMNQQQFAAKNKRNYPQTSKVIKRGTDEKSQKENKKVVLPNRKIETRKKIVPRKEQDKTKIDVHRKKNIQKRVPKPKANPRTNRGVEYHKNKWEKTSKSTYKRKRPQTQPSRQKINTSEKKIKTSTKKRRAN